MVAEDQEKVLVIYTADESEMGEDQRSLDMLLGHFTTDITFISSSEVDKKDLADVTQLFYYGTKAVELPDQFTTMFDDYEGTFTAIGYNANQLGEHFSFISYEHEVEINSLYLTENKEQKLEDLSLETVEVHPEQDAETLMKGKNESEDKTYPVMVQQDNHFYYSIDTMYSNEVVLFGEALHDIFEVNHEDTHPGYIRLEDIHPAVDTDKLKKIAQVLKEKDIPYMVSVIPVYTDPETEEEMHFSDSPELLGLLKKMQKDGASIILHGYTHQYRSSETGEGFEFWDVENNSPIFSPSNETMDLKSESDFSSKKKYEAYLAELQTFETDYVHEKLEKGVQELVNYGLYPLAFEAPHYTMSQNGYEIASDYFSHYAGQAQLSDTDWEKMDSTPYISSPSFLGGMELLPETIGYVNPEEKDSIPKMMKQTEQMLQTKDGVIAGFYHPYLGIEGFHELIEQMEKQPNIDWIDLKQEDVWVKAENVHLSTEDGNIVADVDKTKLMFSSSNFLSYHYFAWSTVLTWILCFIGAVFVLTFIVLTLFNQHRKKQYN